MIETTADHSTLLQAQVADLLVAPLEQSSTFLSAGPRIIDSASPVRIPRIVHGVTAGFVGEGELISAGGIADGASITPNEADRVRFDEVTLLPSQLRSIKVLVKFSNEIARQAVIGLEQVLRTRLITDVANALDAALWDGDGADDSIRGIFKADGITTATLDLGDIDSLIDAQAQAQGDFVSPTHWVMTPASFAKLRKIKVGSDDARYVINPQDGVQPGTRFQLLGLPVIITQHIPDVGGKARAALVDFNKVVVARDIDSTVRLLDQTFGDYDSLALRVVTRFDVANLQDQAVTVLKEK